MSHRFYKGTLPRMARVCMDVAAVFTLYDIINGVLDKFFEPPK
jgi:hypothetical protein